MRIPKDISLESFIRSLIADNNLMLFYKSKDWLELRQEVMQEYHNECVLCAQRGRYTKADCVHHVNEVRHRPDMALTKHFIDDEGNKQLNLLPLCNRCHNEVHDKLGEWQRKDKFTNEERW